MINWRHEVALLREKNKEDTLGTYVCDCLEEVLNLLEKQNHSGISLDYLKYYMNLLTDGKTLFPLTDNPSEWNQLKGLNIGEIYQNNRYCRLFKYANSRYSDIGRAVVIDTHPLNSGKIFRYTNLVNLIDEMFPITMPYTPCDNPYKIFAKLSLIDNEGNDITREDSYECNYIEISHIITPDNKLIKLDKIIDRRKS